MPILTIEAIRQNPWSVLTHELPSDASVHLLTLAQVAATCCRQIEFDTLDLVSEHTCVDRCVTAHRKIGEIIARLEDNYGVVAREIMLGSNTG